MHKVNAHLRPRAFRATLDNEIFDPQTQHIDQTHSLNRLLMTIGLMARISLKGIHRGHHASG